MIEGDTVIAHCPKGVNLTPYDGMAGVVIATRSIDVTVKICDPEGTCIKRPYKMVSKVYGGEPAPSKAAKTEEPPAKKMKSAGLEELFGAELMAMED